MKETSKCRSAATSDGACPLRRSAFRSMARTVSRRGAGFFVPPVGDLATAWRLPVEFELYSQETMPRPRAQLDTVALARAFADGGLRGTSIDAVAAAAG